ncbi:MAG: ATP-binding protein [Candidatus Thiodiazotropha sp. (ex Cardiolucina cf. quadrata)]|nr:ATP-binding protein [Candidatus Thiodiazotropha sp. (ex Cardiolucina cf. quadrata)]
MFIKTIEYKEFPGTSREWILENFSFEKIVLIVGKNASGKTRALNVIGGLSSLLNSETNLYSSAEYRVEFINTDNELFIYELKLSDHIVIDEKVIINNKILLERKLNGIGNIYTQQIDKYLEFQTHPQQLAVINKRDKIQHAFLEDLHEWSNNVMHYKFSNDYEKSTLLAFVSKEINHKTKFHPISLLKKGSENYDNSFKSNIIQDMNSIGYNISDIGIEQPWDISSIDGHTVNCIFVKEKEMKGNTQQVQMSDGMFRALSLIIKFNYLLLHKSKSWFLVDDIGEGLDFERAKSLINLIINKAKVSSIQVIMTTNDQFIMNGIPLEYWSIATRESGTVRFINKNSNKEQFENFKFIGLNNFEFFASDFFLPHNDK